MKKIIIGALLAFSSLQAYFFYSPEMREANLSAYTEEEKSAIEKDLFFVKSVCFSENPQPKDRPLYIATAGSPGSRKTTILERFLNNHEEYSDCVYLDPDPRTLKYMAHTYISRSLSPLLVSQVQDYDQVIQDAYNKWRYASTHICAALLEEAFQNRRDVAHGTTMTGKHAPPLLKSIQDAGYKITLLLCSCEDDFRVNSITYRNAVQRFYQSSPEDAIAKGKLFPERMETYFTYADKLYFFWSDDLMSPERLAGSYKGGKLTIHDADAWDRFVRKYERDRQALRTEGKELPSWEELLKMRAS